MKITLEAAENIVREIRFVEQSTFFKMINDYIASKKESYLYTLRSEKEIEEILRAQEGYRSLQDIGNYIKGLKTKSEEVASNGNSSNDG